MEWIGKIEQEEYNISIECRNNIEPKCEGNKGELKEVKLQRAMNCFSTCRWTGEFSSNIK